MCFQTAYKLSSLTSYAKEAEQFTLEQHAIYSPISEEFGYVDKWSGAKKTQFAINALALCCFGKPIAAKSWYFDSVPSVLSLRQYQIAYLKLGARYATVITLQFDANSVYCMLLEDQLVLEENKVLKQFSPLKVMANRLFNNPL